MNILNRSIQSRIEENLFQNKVILIFGTRRVGKTTLLKQFIEEYSSRSKKCIYLDCDLLRVKQIWETENEKLLEKYISDYDILAIDEAQNIENIGQILKVIHDVFPEKQLIVQDHQVLI